MTALFTQPFPPLIVPQWLNVEMHNLHICSDIDAVCLSVAFKKGEDSAPDNSVLIGKMIRNFPWLDYVL